MESRVLQTMLLLGGVLVLVYRAFFRSVEVETNKNLGDDLFATSALSNQALEGTSLPSLDAQDPFRDLSPDSATILDTRIQVMTTGAKTVASSPTVIPQPVVIDGLKFHATTDLFDGNTTDAQGTFVGASSLPSMYVRQGQQKILAYLGLSSFAKIIYKDIHNTHFILLSSFDLNQWKGIVQKLGGSFLAIGSQIDRNNRGLFGDNAYQLTIPKYRSTKMIRLLNTHNEWRYIQMDKDRYESGGKDFVKLTLPLYYNK